MTHPVPDRDLRVSDEERAHIVGVLESASGRGLIDLDEFSSRSALALQARTRGELNAQVVDLPDIVNTAAPREVGSPSARSILANMRRNGQWTVPSVLDLHSSLGSAELDFTQALFRSHEVHIRISMSLGSARLRLPPNVSVDLSRLAVSMGSVHAKGVATVEQPGEHHLVLSGRIVLGSLDIKRRRSRSWLRS